MPIVLNILPIALEIEKETLLFAIVYQMPVSLGSFIDDFFYWLMNCQHNKGCWYVGDFNLHQTLSEHVVKANPLIQNFNLSQHLQYSTHVHGGILDLVFDTLNFNTVSSLPSPYSHDFVLFFSQRNRFLLLFWSIILQKWHVWENFSPWVMNQKNLN